MISLGVLWENSEQLMLWTKNNLYRKEREQFMQWPEIILCRMLEIVYVENNEQFLWKNNE